MTHTRKYELIAEHLLSNTAPWFLSCRTYLLLAPCRFSRWTVTFNFSRGRVFRRSGQRNDGSVPWIKAPKSQNKFKNNILKLQSVCATILNFGPRILPTHCRRTVLSFAYSCALFTRHEKVPKKHPQLLPLREILLRRCRGCRSYIHRGVQ